MKQIYQTNSTKTFRAFSTVLVLLLNGWSLYANIDAPALAEIFNLERTFSKSKYVQTSAIPASMDGFLNATTPNPDHYELVSGQIMENDIKEGVFLASRSEGRVYEPAKYMAKHLDGGQVEEIFNYAFNHIFSFIVTKYITEAGATEFSTTFSAYQNQDGTLNLESHWLASQYPKDKTFFNFQVWARNMKQLEVSVGDILNNVLSNRSLNEIYSTKSPKVYLAKQIQQGQLLDLEIINEKGIRTIQIQGSTKYNGQSFPNPIQLTLSGATKERISLPIDEDWSFDGQLTYGQQNRDQVSLGDGSWGVYYGAAQGQIDQFRIIQPNASRPANRTLQSGLEVTGAFTENIMVTRTIIGEPLVWKELESFHCEVEGQGAIAITFILDNGLDFTEQPRAEMMLDQATELAVSFDQFPGLENEVIKSIVFEVIPNEDEVTSSWTFGALSFN